MSKWIDADLIDRQIMIRRVSDEKHFADSAAEKDWWVTLCLKAIFSLPYAPYMLFKGGTSLSKGWNIISRFSEDIDLTISQRFFLEQLQLSYANMLATYIYDHTSALTYDEIIQRMEQLREQFRKS